MSFRQKDKNGKPKPDKKPIAKHWELPLGECWACGVENPYELHRAHIIALQCGGTNDYENFHLLCYVCHYESEQLIGKQYEQWFRLKTSMYIKGRLQPNGFWESDYESNEKSKLDDPYVHRVSNFQALDELIFIGKIDSRECLIEKELEV